MVEWLGCIQSMLLIIAAMLALIVDKIHIDEVVNIIFVSIR